MGTAEVWLGNESWPNNKSCKSFAEDVFRISGAKTDKEKALAFYDWFTRCMMRGANLQIPDGAGGYSRCYDSLALLTSWGHGECTFWGWVATECLVSAGLKARRVVVHNQGHTYYEIFYKGDDGVEQWHAFDPFGGWYFVNEAGEVASCEQLAENPQLAQNPLPGHPVPLGHHPDRASLGHRHRTEDQIFVDQPIHNEKNIWKLKSGMEVVMNFMPQVPHLGLFTDIRSDGPRRNGSHDDMTEDSRLGIKQYQNHKPYWENYLWPSDARGGVNEGRPVRWHGEGALRWKPLQQNLSNACEVRNAVIKNGALSPSGSHEFMEVWYHIELPYMASYIMADYDVVGAGGDFFGLCISADDRKSWWPMPLKSNSPHYGVTSNGQKQWLDKTSSVQGLKEFWLRIDMVSHHDNISLAMQSLNLTIGFQHNMHVQPRLLPGKNELWLDCEKNQDGVNVTAEWVYQKDGKQFIESLENSKEGKVSNSLSIDGNCPSEIKMSSVRLIAK
ncbi:MAG: hypothetical protein COA79_14270 [Planctomycetota bacterium]|nr:MAG: hypothetical protein COA79_14270 [Planctomycetota bacterium]